MNIANRVMHTPEGSLLASRNEKSFTNGLLIVVEGMDGSGKSTQAKLLFNWIRALGLPVHHTEWNSSHGNNLKTVSNKVYTSSILEHLLIQQLSSFRQLTTSLFFRFAVDNPPKAPKVRGKLEPVEVVNN